MNRDNRGFSATQTFSDWASKSFAAMRALSWVLLGVSIAAPAFAQISSAAATAKLATDLLQIVGTSSTAAANLNWARYIGGRHYVKALVVGSAADPDLLALRSAVVAVGGTVYYKSIKAFLANLMSRASVRLTV
jgi:hypothetical protein